MENWIIVLGCRSTKEPAAALRRRCERAFQLAQEQPDALILLSGGKHWNGISEAESMALYLRAQGIDDSRLHLELLSLTTLENAQYCSAFLSSRNIGNTFLVSCSSHMARALRCFAFHGLHPNAKACASQGESSSKQFRHWLAFLVQLPLRTSRAPQPKAFPRKIGPKAH